MKYELLTKVARRRLPMLALGRSSPPGRDDVVVADLQPRDLEAAPMARQAY